MNPRFASLGPTSFLLFGSLLAMSACNSIAFSDENTSSHAESSYVDLSDWKFVWQDEFDYPNEQLDRRWEAQNGRSGHILCSRWRDNAVVSDGVLQLVNKKENRGGQEWTSASIWTK